MRFPLLGALAMLALIGFQAAAAQAVFKDPVFDPALPPTTVENIQPVLDRDLAGELKNGALAPGTNCGLVIGVIQHGVRRVYAYGPVKPDSVFEIGSITKTFTGLLLAQMIEQNKVRMDDPVRLLLPEGIVQKPVGEEITLRDLTTQHSDLPPNPENMHPADPQNPFADYSSRDLYAYLHTRGVQHAPQTSYAYSNTGVKLLAQALVARTGVPYESLLQQQITRPLGMHDTSTELSPEMKRRFVQGHDAQHRPTEPYTFSDLPGAGAIHSTANDMLTYLEAQLHPERVHAVGPAKSLPAALLLTHQIQAAANPGMHIAMNWFHSDADGNYQHGGRTGGFITYTIFNIQEDFGVVVLSNTAAGTASLTPRLANRIGQRLLGLPAISLVEK
jgi:CubicO group peptidase (beta-lactamase class C family)